jgi:hypothetical protein
MRRELVAMGRFECVEDAIGKTGATTVIVPQLLTVIQQDPRFFPLVLNR